MKQRKWKLLVVLSEKLIKCMDELIAWFDYEDQYIFQLTDSSISYEKPRRNKTEIEKERNFLLLRISEVLQEL